MISAVRSFDMSHLRGFVAVAEIATDRILYNGRSTATAAPCLQPGTHFAWGDSQDKAKQQVHREIDLMKKGGVL